MVLAVGTPAPGFNTTDTQGNQVSLADFAGKTVVLNFWSTRLCVQGLLWFWCRLPTRRRPATGVCTFIPTLRNPIAVGSSLSVGTVDGKGMRIWMVRMWLRFWGLL